MNEPFSNYYVKSDLLKFMICKSCNAEISSKYCPNCGQPSAVKRINSHYLIHEIEHVLHFEKGILYTIRELVTHPGVNVRKFITDDRSRLVKPIIFIIITSLIYSLVNNAFDIEAGYVQYESSKKTAAEDVAKWVQGHYGYANIIMGLFIALWAKVFFRRSAYNIYEVLILLCFIMGMSMLLYALFALIQGLLHIDMMSIAGILALVYSSWAIGQFFGGKGFARYLKAISAYILGVATFTIAAGLVAVIIEVVR